MITGLILVQGNNLKTENLIVSLHNAKHLVKGDTGGFGVMINLAANTHSDYQNALLEFSKVDGVTQVMTIVMNVND